VVYAPLTEYGSGVIAERTPVILAAENGAYTIGVGGEAQAYEGTNNLGGVLKSKSVSGTIYMLANGEFAKRTATSGTVTANTAYYTTDSQATSIALKKGEATSVKGIETAENPVKFYDLKGNLVEKPARGIYVTSEGKKVLVK
jgi:hypothetical protein